MRLQIERGCLLLSATGQVRRRLIQAEAKADQEEGCPGTLPPPARRVGLKVQQAAGALRTGVAGYGDAWGQASRAGSGGRV